MIEKMVNDVISLHEHRRDLLINESRPKINWLSICTPEEIIYAAGMIPYRITGETRPNFIRANTYMHRNICPYVLSCFEEALDGVHKFAAGTIIVNACDARRRLYDVWKFYDDTKFLHLLDFPKVVNPATKNYFKNQLRELIKAIERYFHCKITDDSLREAITLCNETRILLSELYDLRRKGIAPISGSQAINLVKACMTGLREEFNKRLSRLLEEIKNIQNKNSPKKHRVLLCGSYFDHANILEIFKAYGADIACEDVSTGVKYFEGLVDPEGDPLDALASYYLEKATCARMTDSQKRFEHLLNLVEEYDIQSVMYFTLKFCDNNLLDFPFIKNKLDERGIPVFLIEAERSVENIEQVKTRVIAFLESRMGFDDAV